ncbi:MAG: T9SS type A sorting domain-containing protein [Salibacteraceae bacterium]
MKTPSLISLLLFFFCQATAQDWKVIGEFNSGIECLYADEKSDLLYVGGAFETVNGNYISGVATWNGQSWGELNFGVQYDSLQMNWGGGVAQITNYQDKLIVVGTFEHVGYYQKSRNAALWNTDSLKWEPLNWETEKHGSIDFIFNTNDTTFVLGTYDSIGGLASKGVNYLHQNQWTNMSPPDGAEIPKVLVPYLGSYYLGGNMNGSILDVNDIARWDGLKFQPVGTGVSGGFGWVNDMIVYQNELYIGGSFTVATGHAGDYIMKWDGQQYHNVGGFDYPITDFKIHNDILYTSGLFDYYEGERTNQIAWYEPEIGWHALSDDDHDVISNFDFYRNELYISRNYNGKKEVLKYQKKLPSSISKKISNTSFNLFPNPSSTIINISGLSDDDECHLVDLNGKILIKSRSSELQISQLNKGVYFIHIQSNNITQTLKFIKL